MAEPEPETSPPVGGGMARLPQQPSTPSDSGSAPRTDRETLERLLLKTETDIENLRSSPAYCLSQAQGYFHMRFSHTSETPYALHPKKY